MSMETEIENRFDICAFTMPDEFLSEEEVFDREKKLLLCRLYIDSFKILTFEEYSALQGILTVSSCWDNTAKAPEHICGGQFRVFSEMPLNLKIITKALDTDMEKMIVLLKSAFVKLPILKTLLPVSLIKEIDETKTMELVNPEEEMEKPAKGKLSKKNFKKIGQTIRKNIYRTDYGKIAYKKKK